jgi:hypothetical protein
VGLPVRAAAKLFLSKALNGLKEWEKPTVISQQLELQDA